MSSNDELRKALQQAVQPSEELTSRMLAGVESKLKAKSQPTLMSDMFSLGWSTLTTLLAPSLSSADEHADRKHKTDSDDNGRNHNRKDVTHG